MALPINETIVKIVPSLNLITIVKVYLSRDPFLPESIRRIVEDTPITSEQATGLSHKCLKSSNSTEKSIEQLRTQKRLCESKPPIIVGKRFENQSINFQNENQKHGSGIQTLVLNDLKWLQQAMLQLRKKNEDLPYLHELMMDCEIVLPENNIMVRNPELEARCQKLRREQETREYKAITRNVDNVRTYIAQDTIAYQVKQINRQLIAVAQFIFSVAAGFAFGFIGIELIVGQLDFGFRLLLGIMIALIIGLAEIYFLAKKLNEDYDVVTTLKPNTGDSDKKTVIETIQIAPKNNLSFDKKLHRD